MCGVVGRCFGGLLKRCKAFICVKIKPLQLAKDKKKVENMKKVLLELLAVPSERIGFMAGSCKPLSDMWALVGIFSSFKGVVWCAIPF